jgi:hypothetical protein
MQITKPMLILVKAKKNGQVYDETLLEFPYPPSEQKLERELHFTKVMMAKHLNIKGLEFSFAPVSNLDEAKRSKLWNYRGNHMIVR